MDVVRPQAAFSGNLYSVEFYELLRGRLRQRRSGGPMACHSPHIQQRHRRLPLCHAFSVASYDGSQFFIASQQPIVFDRQEILERLQALNPTGAFSAAQVQSFTQFLLTVEPAGARSGEPAAPTTEHRLNRDLAPRDEYFLNNPP